MHPWAPHRVLLETADLRGDRFPAHLAGCRPVADAILTWAEEYLGRPDPALERTGTVCPFVPVAIRLGCFWISPCLGVYDHAAAVRTVLAMRDWFTELDPVDGPHAQFKTVQLVFPDLTVEAGHAIVGPVQRELADTFMAAGLMLGQFSPIAAEPAPGDDRVPPVGPPVPLLSIRTMVPTDLPFVARERRFAEVYRDLFGDALPRRQRVELARVLAQPAPAEGVS